MIITFHGDDAIKEKYLTRLREHRAADEIIKGVYWEDGKGCAVGCTIHGSDHKSYEDELGISMIIARLEDRIFEDLPNEIAKDFPIRFLEAVPVGVDVGIVFYQFMHWLLADKDDGVIKYVADDKKIEVIQNVTDLFLKKINGDKVSEKELNFADDYADKYAAHADADEYAAYAVHAAYAYVGAASSHLHVDCDAKYASFVAADAASDCAAAHAHVYINDNTSASYASAYEKYRVKQANKLIELLSQCV